MKYFAQLMTRKKTSSAGKLIRMLFQISVVSTIFVDANVGYFDLYCAKTPKGSFT